MIRWLVTSAIYAAVLSFSSKLDAGQAIAIGLLAGAISIGAVKLFGMDKKD